MEKPVNNIIKTNVEVVKEVEFIVEKLVKEVREVEKAVPIEVIREV